MKRICLESLKVGWIVCGIVSFVYTGCHQKQEKWFTALGPKHTGITFSNDIHDNDSSYSFINEFGYMGGGVGIGDFNNDGLQDLVFTGNQVSSRLYINLGAHQFEDITEKAGFTTTAWCTGVSIADINGDGYDDIYISVFGKDLKTPSGNLLFINQGDLTFKEQAAEYGVADVGYSSQAVFLDYDRDGDLDLYVANYLLSTKNANSIFPRDHSGRSPANDRLYRNDGDPHGKGHPVFTDVTLEAGIRDDGYGLGVSVSDFNNDGWPDIYVGNDFVSNDLLWMNNGDGTFTNRIAQALRHQSYSSMGTDAADINNDGLPDIMSLDMLPEYNERRKTSFSFMNYDRYQAERNMGYEPQFMRNMLQLNNGNRRYGNATLPLFSETGELSGVDATDWSWSVLLADFNNDGWKDIHVTNGIGRDFINADFLEFSNTVFGSSRDRKEQQEIIMKKLASLEPVKLSNYLYVNRQDLTFSNESSVAGIGEPSLSNGAAYADIDNDGDLDLVVNNINQPPFIFINNTNTPGKPSRNHYLVVGLEGDSLNGRGFGSKLMLYSGNNIRFQEQNPVRGYASSVDQRLLFGWGKDEKPDSLVIIWPDMRKQVLKNVPVDTFMELSWQQATEKPLPVSETNPTLFRDITGKAGITYLHQESSFNDFAQQPLLPQKYSQQGPAIATGDINNDGIMDFFVGGAFNFSGRLFQQAGDQRFSAKDLTDAIKYEEDTGCIFFDANNDGFDDLLIAGGDVQYTANSPYYKPRLYINDRKGNFSLQQTAFADSIRTIAGTVSAYDYDGDGDMDIFIGGRVSKIYPEAPRSFLLQNNNGVFTDVTASVCPELQTVGMITSSVWADVDGDNKADLVIAGDWMPVRFFKNNGSRLDEITGSTGLMEMNGMWRSLIAADIDNDGDIDLVAGNLGLNNGYRVSSNEPMELLAADLDGNGSIEPVPFYYIKNKEGKRVSFPAISRSQLSVQIPGIKKQFPLHENFAAATAGDIFKKENTVGMIRLHCNELRSCYLENTGNGKFIKHPLPVEAQFSPVNAIVCDDFDKDGYQDILIAGNEYQAEVTRGRYDASYGLFLKGTGKGAFTAIPPVKSGFIINGDVKDMKLIVPANVNYPKLLVVAVNNDSLKVFSLQADP